MMGLLVAVAFFISIAYIVLVLVLVHSDVTGARLFFAVARSVARVAVWTLVLIVVTNLIAAVVFR